MDETEHSLAERAVPEQGLNTLAGPVNRVGDPPAAEPGAATDTVAALDPVALRAGVTGVATDASVMDASVTAGAAMVAVRRAGRGTLAVYLAATLLGAALLFMVQPMAVRMVLPRLGGSPAVWNASMVFFQGTLLIGYLYAHVLTRRWSLRRQVVIHVVVLAIPLVVLPMRLPGWRPPGDGAPIPWLLAMLCVAVGLPFLVVTTASPLLQRWFSQTDHRHSADPYPLYAASNVGSLVGLAAYPAVIERALGLREQAWAWAGGYVLFGGFVLWAGHLARRGAAASGAAAEVVGGIGVALPVPGAQGADMDGRVDSVTSRVGAAAPAFAQSAEGATPYEAPAVSLTGPRTSRELWQQRARWVALAAVPSALSLAVTASLSIDVASAPFLWVMPLGVYLLTFILAFGRRTLIPVPFAGFFVPVCVAALGAALHDEIWPSVRVAFAVQLVTLFWVGMLCHGRLHEERPGPERLTEFFLLVSLGGVVGGATTALLAPVVFTSVVELPLVLVAAVLARHRWLTPSRWLLVDGALFVAFAVTLAYVLSPDPQLFRRLGISRIVSDDALTSGHETLRRVLQWDEGSRFLVAGLAIGLMALATRKIAASMCAALLAVSALQASPEGTLLQTRTFFGALRVSEGGCGEGCEAIDFSHGTTLHGQQLIDPSRRSIATSYYHRTGPAGSVMTRLEGDPRHGRVGVIGLGAGTLATYSRPGDRFTYFEIDPEVARIASNPEYFTYLSDAQGEIDIVLGDARLTIEDQPDDEFGVLVIDAFSSDAIPVHLLTKEAIALYLSKLRGNGVLLVHVSNRHLRLDDVVGRIARDLGVAARTFDDGAVSPDEEKELKTASTWVALTRDTTSFDGVADLGQDTWVEAAISKNRTWTDDYANLLDVLNWES